MATANWYKYINDIIDQFVPRRTFHRQSLPPWISSSTFHLMKILQTKRKQYRDNPSDFRRIMHQTERKLTIALECDRSSYLEKLSHTRDTHKLDNSQKCSMPPKICHGSKTAVSDVDKVNLLNQYLQSVFSADESFDLNYMESFSNTDLLEKLDSVATSAAKIEHILNNLDVSKTRCPNSLPPCFFRQLSSVISIYPFLHMTKSMCIAVQLSKFFFHNSQLHKERLLDKSQNPREIRTCSLPIARHMC